ncbi:TraR/DksA C4-type zinc finger protein [Nitratidesulfovibrio sp. D1]|uniref:TraR/DksA C4-type zinc finger protein n=1 Tax=Nitratidesulfovibrio sp. D1 TaxID=3440151 RepID=UPI003EBD46B8
MADAADIATEREFILRQEALARLRAARGAQRASLTSLASRATCEECGDPIPEARRAAVPGVRLCITCQKELEA